MVAIIHVRTHKDNTWQDLTKEKNKTSHLLAIRYSITALDNFDINLTMHVGVISLGSLQPKYIRHLLVSAPSLGVYYFVSMTLSVRLFVCSFKSILLFCFSMESSHFLAVISPYGPLQNVVLQFLI